MSYKTNEASFVIWNHKKQTAVHGPRLRATGADDAAREGQDLMGVSAEFDP
jgi:hypothetical protein